jgi:hypothetical protein
MYSCKKDEADKNGIEGNFKVGDLLFLKVQPYVQSSLLPFTSFRRSFRIQPT